LVVIAFEGSVSCGLLAIESYSPFAVKADKL